MAGNLERIDFEDGNYWWIRNYLSRGAGKAVGDIARRSFIQPDGEATPQDMIDGKFDVTVDWKNLELEEMNDMLLLKSTTEWSYGPVTKEILETVPQAHYQRVLERMNGGQPVDLIICITPRHPDDNGIFCAGHHICARGKWDIL